MELLERVGGGVPEQYITAGGGGGDIVPLDRPAVLVLDNYDDNGANGGNGTNATSGANGCRGRGKRKRRDTGCHGDDETALHMVQLPSTW